MTQRWIGQSGNRPGLTRLVAGCLIVLMMFGSTPTLWAQDGSDADDGIEIPESTADALKLAADFALNDEHPDAFHVLDQIDRRQNLTPADRSDWYITYVRVCVLRANGFPEGQEIDRDRWLDAARQYAEECLRQLDLRHTRPASDIQPPEVSGIFEDAHDLLHGRLLITNLEPRDALVVLHVSDAVADTLRWEPEATAIEVRDIPAGSRLLEVSAEGHQFIDEELVIDPGRTLTVDYALSKNKSKLRLIAGVVGIVGGALVLGSVLGGGSDTPADPLPGPPAPPN